MARARQPAWDANYEALQVLTHGRPHDTPTPRPRRGTARYLAYADTLPSPRDAQRDAVRLEYGGKGGSGPSLSKTSRCRRRRVRRGGPPKATSHGWSETILEKDSIDETHCFESVCDGARLEGSLAVDMVARPTVHRASRLTPLVRIRTQQPLEFIPRPARYLSSFAWCRQRANHGKHMACCLALPTCSRKPLGARQQAIIFTSRAWRRSQA
jgi:hypothetical protein